MIINTFSRSLPRNMVKREKVNSAISRELLRKVYSGSKGQEVGMNFNLVLFVITKPLLT